MNLYERYVLPRLIDLAMRNKASRAERARAIRRAAGTVVTAPWTVVPRIWNRGQITSTERARRPCVDHLYRATGNAAPGNAMKTCD